MIETNLLTIFMAGLPLGVAAGFVMHRSDFCLTGAFRDLFLFRQTFMLRILTLGLVASMILFEAARRTNLLVAYPFPILASPSIANMVGGFVFGIGMVLAGGCVVGTLYKMGAGSVLSAVAFIGLIVGSGLYAEIHPAWASLAGQWAFLKGNITLPQALSLDPGWLVAATALISASLFLKWQNAGLWTRKAYAEGYLQPWKAALLLSGIGLGSYLVAGMPFGISTAYAKAAAYLEATLTPDHVQSLAYFQALPLKYTDPLSGAYLEGGAAPHFDAIAAIQFPVILGIIAGSFFSSLRLGEFRLRFNIPGRQYAISLIGGITMAMGSRMTPGCNVWHLLGGLPIFSLQSLLFLAGLLPGAWVGSLLIRRILHDS